MEARAASRRRLQGWRTAAVVGAMALAALAAWRIDVDPRAAARALASERPCLAGVLYFTAYAAAAALCLPGIWALSAVGGALFGFKLGFGLALGANAAGAALAMVAARRWLREAALARHPGVLARAHAAATRDGVRFVIAARLTPFVPFFLVNLAAGLAGMRLAPFVAASLAGAAPLVALSAWTGARSAAAPLAPSAAAGLAALAAALWLVPPLARRWRARRSLGRQPLGRHLA